MAYLRHLCYIAIMGIAKVTRNFQVTIPKDVRQAEGVMVGDTLLFTATEGKLEVTKMGRAALLKALAGTWKDRGTGVEYENRVRSGWKKRANDLGY